MSEPSRPGPVPLGVSLTVVLALATLGSFAAGFGVMTDCTGTYGCTSSECPPCATADAWLTAGWGGQSVLLLLGGVLAVLGRRGVRPRRVRLLALVLAAVSIALFTATTGVAISSF